MRTFILALSLLILVSGALLSACGDDSEDTPSKSPDPNTGNITITAKDFSFDNTSLTAKAGQPVHITFKNEGKHRAFVHDRQGR